MNDLMCLCKHGLVVVILWIGLRIAFIIGFVPIDALVNESQVLPRLLFNAVRFDLQVAVYTLLLPTLLIFVSALAYGIHLSR